MVALTAALVAVYNTPDYVLVFEDVAKVLAAVIAAATVLAALGRFLIVRPLLSYIDSKTAQIQPNANGGQSLADLHKRVDDIQETLGLVVQYILTNERDGNA